MVCYYKVRQLFYYKVRQVLQSATIITKCDSLCPFYSLVNNTQKIGRNQLGINGILSLK